MELHDKGFELYENHYATFGSYKTPTNYRKFQGKHENTMV